MIKADEIIKIRKPRPDYPVIKEIANRFSPRYFSEDVVKENDINIIFEAARFAPSGWNFQPWYFYWTKKESTSYNKIVSCLTRYNRFAKTAPILIAACFIKKFKGKKTYYRHDLGAAVMSLVLQAQHLGYYCRQMGDFNKNKLIKLLNINKTNNPFVIIALGKLGDYKNINDRLLKRELDPRPRKKDFVKKLD
ncbi:MAG: Nitroreductase [Candidatus Roizmanbacteria bacterium GW2011_GWA2_32_13]|uniref:Nitroreductase n=1 Tax=Candidatus Roizmanbacteria bacterium GW2011_GWA2_32_13 TaxID=1618475 RepID=A0A0G0BQG5_9BACT|nr:MAG: Nitroreductase [Candidatus Roizmanbacteria bacterium GW2011_GWA2_32_13]